MTGLCFLIVSLEGLNQFLLRNLFTRVIITFSFFIISDQDYSGVGIIDIWERSLKGNVYFDRANAQILQAFIISHLKFEKVLSVELFSIFVQLVTFDDSSTKRNIDKKLIWLLNASKIFHSLIQFLDLRLNSSISEMKKPLMGTSWRR